MTIYKFLRYIIYFAWAVPIGLALMLIDDKSLLDVIKIAWAFLSIPFGVFAGMLIERDRKEKEPFDDFLK